MLAILIDDFSLDVAVSRAYFRYWGKAKTSPEIAGTDYHLLPYHCLDVAAVGYQVLGEDNPLCKDIAELLSIKPSLLRQLFTFTLALHDLGKFAGSFQNLNVFDELGEKPCIKVYDAKKARHDQLGFTILHQLVQQEHIDLAEWFPEHDEEDVEEFIAALFNFSFGHHGKPVKHGKKSANNIKKHLGKASVLDAKTFVLDVLQLLPVDWHLLPVDDEEWLLRFKQVSWYLSGLAVFCDWLGSDNSIFQYKAEPEPLADYWAKALKLAQNAVAQTEVFNAVKAQPFNSIKEQFGFSPSPLQQWSESVEINSSGQLLILEDITGAGKTETALALTHRLIEAGHADGFYFGLPTMATSNAMFGRVASHYSKMLSDQGQPVSLVLAHGAREMNETFQQAKVAGFRQDANYSEDDESTSLYCNQWLADSRKKALLSPVGVGTIDQPLLAILPSKHQSLRLLGLHRKVLIFDEVHSADEYMFELLDDLLTFHARHGGSAILLSATLAQKQRARLAKAWLKGAHIEDIALPKSEHFPLATQVTLCGEVREDELSSRPELSRTIDVEFVHSEADCVNQIVTAVQQRKCVVWIRNSVDDAYRAYQKVQAEIGNQEDCLLFHSRFVLGDRKEAENKVLDWFGKSSSQTIRAGKVLIATQVFQESIDADLDVMISDICPIDDLLQRSGRLMRHTRNEQGQHHSNITEYRPSPKLIVHAPKWESEPEADWLVKSFRNTQAVYRSPGKLWLSMQKLLQLGCIKMPKHARELIEAVYSDQAMQNIPEKLQEQHLIATGEQKYKTHQADRLKLNWQEGFSTDSSSVWFDDEIDISTRYSDLEYVEVLVLKLDDAELTPIFLSDKHSIQLSTVKLEKHRTAERLAELPEQYQAQLELLQQAHSKVSYLKAWLPELDPQFGYSQVRGVYKRESPQSGESS